MTGEAFGNAGSKLLSSLAHGQMRFADVVRRVCCAGRYER
jgi:hypothetical protein